MTASETAELVATTRLSISRIFDKIRQRVDQESERASPFSETVEVDESYFGTKRVRDKRGHCAFEKTIVFEIFKCNGAVYTEIVPNCKVGILQAIIRWSRRTGKRCSLGRLAQLRVDW